jgi:hypothetical protein
MSALGEAGIIDSEGRRLVVLDWQGLQSAGEFDPKYLHLKERPKLATVSLGVTALEQPPSGTQIQRLRMLRT